MSDPRFARLKSDPRFRRPKKKHAKVVVDERFKSVFAQDKKKKAGRVVDKYGRPISETQDKDDLRRYYRLENDAEEETPLKQPDLARGEVLLESSDEEEEPGKDSEDEDDGFITLGTDSIRPINVLNDDEAEIDLDEDTFADLEQQAADYAQSQASDEEGATSRTPRLAIVNLDWDHVRARHIYKICASLVSATAPAVQGSAARPDKKSTKNDIHTQVNVVRGKVLSVRVYPSNFGKERMAREEKEGPPPEIFKRKELQSDEINEKNIYEVGGEEEYDEDALRKYQLERLRYYYAIVTCDTVDAASHIYNELEGTELERSANVFDMSFVPDDMTFENDPRDEATDDVSSTYKGIEFVTDALRHSKVKLTWDDDDPDRNQITRRALTKKEIEENDFRAYIANTSSESEGEGEPSIHSKKNSKASREKMRALLLGGNDEAMPEGWGDDAEVDDVDMQITFTPGLSSKKNEEDETTIEKYQRKMKEKRKKRKEESSEKPRKDEENQTQDDFFEVGSEDDEDNLPENHGHSKERSNKARGKTKTTEELDTRPEITVEELALLVGPDAADTEPKHFNIKAVIKAEKEKKRKKRGKSKAENYNTEIQEDFIMNVKDERFIALHEDHQFAIDPTHPQFKKTKGMAALLEERRKRQREKRGEEAAESVKGSKLDVSSGQSLQGLVDSVKRKSESRDQPGKGKRRKL